MEYKRRVSEIHLTKGSFWFALFVVLSIGIVILISFSRYYFLKEYLLYIKVPCNLQEDECFVHECEDGDVRCASAKNGTVYYKILYKKENRITSCINGECPVPSCELNEDDCFYITCSEEIITEFDLSDTCSSSL